MKNALLIKIFISIALAIGVGLWAGPTGEIFGVLYIDLFDLIGRLFLNALMLVVVPLVVASIITGAARIGGEQSFGTLGLKTFSAFVGINLLAILIGLFFADIMQPGAGQAANITSTLDASVLEKIEQSSQVHPFEKISQILLKIVPANIISTAAEGQMLGLIFFSLLFGYFLSKVESGSAAIMLGFWKALFNIMMSITHLVMRALPLGVFGLVAKVFAQSGVESFRSVGLFSATVLLALGAYLFIALPLLLKFVAGVSPLAHFRAMAPALFTAFSTSSSAASLPITIDCVEKRAGVSNRICSFTIPLGTSVSLSGSALYGCVSVIFIAQAYGLELTLATQCIIVLMCLLTSLGMAGIPSAVLITIVIVLQTIGLPAEGIGLLLAVERLFDMCRSSVNVFSNTCCSVLVARSEGEKTFLNPEMPQEVL